MAYFSKENKKELAPKIKEVCKKYGVKATMAVRHNSTFVLNIRSGDIDFISNYNSSIGDRNLDSPRMAETDHINVNVYWYDKHFSGIAKDFLGEVIKVMNNGNHDNSDIMTDYWDVGWYIDVNIGNYDKPYHVID